MNRIDRLVNEEVRMLKVDNMRRCLGMQDGGGEVYRGENKAIAINCYRDD